MKLKIKLILGFRQDQEHSISADEAHKAYYAFMNPENRVIFSDGLAVRGEDIRGIEPDYQGTMGWNTSHKLDNDDWNEIRQSGADIKLRNLMYDAKQIASKTTKELINLPLLEAKQKLLK